MSNIAEEFKEFLKNIAGAWTSYAALGTFLLYLTGYLSLRFHLTVLGIGTDISLIDERYLYAGAKFWVYILLYIPVIILCLLAIAIVFTIFFLLPTLVVLYISRKFSKKVSDEPKVKSGKILNGIKKWRDSPNIITLLGILFSVLIIQLAMRQCLFLSNLIFNSADSKTFWIGEILKDIKLEVLFFGGIITGTIITGILLYYAWVRYKKLAVNTLTQFLLCILTVLFAIQFLLLPVNHGVLVADKTMPKIKDLGGVETLSAHQNGWLIWEGSETVTYFIETRSGDEATNTLNIEKKLVTLPKKEIKRTEIVGYDRILSR